MKTYVVIINKDSNTISIYVIDSNNNPYKIYIDNEWFSPCRNLSEEVAIHILNDYNPVVRGAEYIICKHAITILVNKKATAMYTITEEEIKEAYKERIETLNSLFNP